MKLSTNDDYLSVITLRSARPENPISTLLR
jgi:hypothetical protein